MTFGKPTAYGKLCHAIDALVADRKSEKEIIEMVERYYAHLQREAVEQGVTLRFLASGESIGK